MGEPGTNRGLTESHTEIPRAPGAPPPCLDHVASALPGGNYPHCIVGRQGSCSGSPQSHPGREARSSPLESLQGFAPYQAAAVQGNQGVLSPSLQDRQAGRGTCPSLWRPHRLPVTPLQRHNRTEWGRVGANGDGRCLIELLLGFELMNHNCKKS